MSNYETNCHRAIGSPTSFLGVVDFRLGFRVAMVALAFAASAAGGLSNEATATELVVSSAGCGDMPSRLIYDIKTSGASCKTARSTASGWARVCAQKPSGSCTVSTGFYCRYRDAGYEAGKIRCTKRGKWVKFVTGS